MCGQSVACAVHNQQGWDKKVDGDQISAPIKMRLERSCGWGVVRVQASHGVYMYTSLDEFACLGVRARIFLGGYSKPIGRRTENRIWNGKTIVSREKKNDQLAKSPFVLARPPELIPEHEEVAASNVLYTSCALGAID